MACSGCNHSEAENTTPYPLLLNMTDFDIPLFRHSVNDGTYVINSEVESLLLSLTPASSSGWLWIEPNDDWTVEEVFQWTLLRSYKLIDERFETIADGLRSDLDKGGKQLEQVRNDVASQKQPSQTHDVENRPNQGESKTKNDSSNKVPRSTAVVKAKVVASEVYTGREFELKITKKNACLVGRSSSKKFKNNGISLSKDLEVSTTHGKFELHKDGNVYYTDTGSTNGSKIDGDSVEPDEPYLIQNGTILLVGATKFELTVL